MDVLNETLFLSGEGRPSSSNGLTVPKTLLPGTLPDCLKISSLVLSGSSDVTSLGVSSYLSVVSSTVAGLLGVKSICG